MKKAANKVKGLVKGAPASALVSAGIHLLLFLGLGSMVVFQFVKKAEPQFEPPPSVERKKMELKKPKVKVKSSTRPKSVSRIMSKNVQSMPSVQLPELSGGGTGLTGGGLGGFDLMPDLSEMTVFGNKKSLSVGNDFVGTFYSFVYDRQGRKIDCGEMEWVQIIDDFIQSGWNPYTLAPYFRSPQKLYAAQIYFPADRSEWGPSNFGIPAGPDFDPYRWIVHYKGDIKSPRDTPKRFRFWGMGDDALVVSITGGEFDNTVVADFSWPGFEPTDWKSNRKDGVPDGDQRYSLGTVKNYVGDWFTLEPDVIYEMNIVIGECPGGIFCAYLMVEEEGVMLDYNSEGMPVLPPLRTGEVPEVVKDQLKYRSVKGEVNLEHPLMFNVY
jgi:hypothetical protein